MDVRKSSLRKIRYAVQMWFLLFSLFVGYRFTHFALHFESPGRPFVERPSSVDAFLPIAGLISFKNFLYTGIIEPFHPAAFVMFSAIILVSLVMKKGFCGWICPVGTISQWFWMAGEKVFGKNPRIWKYLDVPLRSAKYLLLAFFLYFIVIRMSAESMSAFFRSDYYKVADAKTMTFFTGMSNATLFFLLAMGVLSLVYKNVWCRYFCPYGALLGLLSLISPFKIKRDEGKCVHCHACSSNCPTLIDVEKKTTVSSSECFSCLTCVSRCPSEGALDISAGGGMKRKALPGALYPVLLLLLFYTIIGSGIIGGKWKSQVTYEEYRRILSADMNSLGHPGR